MPDDSFDVVALLEQTAAAVDVSAADRLLDSVVAATTERPAAASRWPRRLAVAAAIVAGLLVTALLVSSSARHAVARLFGVAGVEITTAPELPEQTTTALELGRTVTATEVPGLVGFAPRRIDTERLGDPAGPFVRDTSVSYVYAPGPDVPETTTPGVGLILTQLTASIDGPLMRKVIGPDTSMEVVDVDGQNGYWIEGVRHGVLFLQHGDDVVNEPIRLAQNVLLWQEGDITFRLEGALSKATAIELARSL